jgi:hypothetical protein
MSERVASFITATLEGDPVCQQIVLFLVENETAMDTTRGIAAWWVNSNEAEAQVALDRLTRCGVITAYALTSGMLYGLTRNPEIRAWLRAAYGAAPPRPHPASVETGARPIPAAQRPVSDQRSYTE